jgi:hypothetical protein
MGLTVKIPEELVARALVPVKVLVRLLLVGVLYYSQSNTCHSDAAA